jgi:hypothetical protein
MAYYEFMNVSNLHAGGIKEAEDTDDMDNDGATVVVTAAATGCM